MLSKLIKNIMNMISKLNHNMKFILSILMSLFLMVCCSTYIVGSNGSVTNEEITTEETTDEVDVIEEQNANNQMSDTEGTKQTTSKSTSSNASVATNIIEPTNTLIPTRQPTNTPFPTSTSLPPTPIPPSPIPPTIPPAVIVSTGSVEITYIYYDGQEKQYEGDEYAEITNTGSTDVNLGGWRLNAGAGGQDFNFPNYTLKASQSCRVYTDEIHSDYCGFSFYSSNSALWNNSGDCGYLFDASGKQVSSRCY